jgi:phage terminase small subunit
VGNKIHTKTKIQKPIIWTNVKDYTLKPIKPPASLSKKSAAYFKTVIDDYEIDDAAIEVLVRVCESIDRADQAAAGLKAAGSLITQDRFGVVKVHPLVVVERMARAAVIDGIKALGILKNEQPNDRYERKVF